MLALLTIHVCASPKGNINWYVCLLFLASLSTELFRKPKRSSEGTLTLQSLTQRRTMMQRRRRKTRRTRAGTGPRSRPRRGWADAASSRSMSPASWRAVTWLTRTMRSAPQTCRRDSRCVKSSVSKVCTHQKMEFGQWGVWESREIFGHLFLTYNIILLMML